MVRRTAACLLALVVLVSCQRKSEAPAPHEPAKKLNAAESRQFSELTIPQIMQGPGLVGTAPSNPRFSADGRHLFFDWNDPAPLDSMNAIDPENAYRHYLDLEYRAATYRMDMASGAIEKLSKADADTTAPDGFAWDRARRHRAELRGGDVFAVEAASGSSRRITDTVDNENTIQISPDGATIYFTRAQQVYATPFAGGVIRQLTNLATGGDPEAKAPPAAQRKFLVDQQKELFDELKQHGPKDWQKDRSRPRKLYLGDGFTITGTSVSPSGKFVSVLVTKDPSGVRKPVIPLVVTESGYTETEEVRTPVGEAQEETKLAFVDVEGDSLLWLDTEEGVIVDVMGWSPTRDVLLIRGIAPDWHTRNFWAVTPGEQAGGKIAPALLDRLQDAAWVDGPAFYETGAWLPDGESIYFISEADKWGHLYTVSLSGKRAQLTRGEFEVYGATLDEARQRWLIVSNEGAPGSQRLWSMGLDGAERRLLTPNRGVYEFTYSPDFARAAVLRSEWTSPPELHLLDLAHGKLDGPFTQSTTRVFRSFPWLAPETISFPASDGVAVAAHVFDPARFGAQPNGAGVVFIHGAGYLQNVIDGWSYYYREYMFNCFLAAHGYTVLNVDYRGSSGYGRDCRTAIYKHMGGRDLDDIVDGARYLVAERGVGANQVGVYGGSYGGFLTLMALFKYPDEIASGAALRSVTDWAHYNHWYTVRILGKPADDPEAFKRSSPIYFADGFSGHLVMLHGLRDDNVLAEDVIRLSQRLIELGKDDWELTLYPVESHGFKRASSWTDEMKRAYRLFGRTLAAPPPNAE